MALKLILSIAISLEGVGAFGLSSVHYNVFTLTYIVAALFVVEPPVW
jgi:hypothetical protein